MPRYLVLLLIFVFACSPLNQNSKQKEFIVEKPLANLVEKKLETKTNIIIERDGATNPNLFMTNRNIKLETFLITTEQVQLDIADTVLVLTNNIDLGPKLTQDELNKVKNEIYLENIASETARSWQFIFESINSPQSPIGQGPTELTKYIALKGILPQLGQVSLFTVAEKFTEIFPNMPANWGDFIKRVKIAALNGFITNEEMESIIEGDSVTNRRLGYNLNRTLLLKRTWDDKPCGDDLTLCEKEVEKVLSFDKIIDKTIRKKILSSKSEKGKERTINILFVNPAPIFAFEKQKIEFFLNYTEENVLIVEKFTDFTGLYEYEKNPIVTKNADGNFKIEIKPSFRITKNANFNASAALDSNARNLVLTFRDKAEKRGLAGKTAVDFALVFKGTGRLNAAISRDKIILNWNGVRDMDPNGVYTSQPISAEIIKERAKLKTSIDGFYGLRWVEKRSDLPFEYYSSESPRKNNKDEYIYQESCFFIKSETLKKVDCK